MSEPTGAPTAVALWPRCGSNDTQRLRSRLLARVQWLAGTPRHPDTRPSFLLVHHSYIRVVTNYSNIRIAKTETWYLMGLFEKPNTVIWYLVFSHFSSSEYIWYSVFGEFSNPKYIRYNWSKFTIRPNTGLNVHLGEPHGGALAGASHPADDVEAVPGFVHHLAAAQNARPDCEQNYMAISYRK